METKLTNEQKKILIVAIDSLDDTVKIKKQPMFATDRLKRICEIAMSIEDALEEIKRIAFLDELDEQEDSVCSSNCKGCESGDPAIQGCLSSIKRVNNN